MEWEVEQIMGEYDFLLLMAIAAGLGSCIAFLLPDGGGMPVRVWPFATKEQSVRFTAWAMAVAAVVAFIAWLILR